MKNILVSIIIPVYNTGEYLYRCIDSVINQSLKEIEIILIDDGSTDNSGIICDKYKEKDNRVHVIHKINEGVSIARNKGISLAKGNYVGFVDSDDWIESEMYERMIIMANNFNSDIVLCDAKTVYSSDNHEKDTFSSLKESTNIHKDKLSALNLQEMAGAVWRCIYKRELLLNNNITFPIDLPLSEDRVFNLHALGSCEKISYLKSAYYNRFVRINSAVSKYYPNLFEITNRYRNEVLTVLDKLWDHHSFKSIYNDQFISLYLLVVYNLFHQQCPLSYKKKLIEIRKLVNDYEVKEVLSQAKLLNWKERSLKHKQVLLLSLLGKLYQIKQHRRESKIYVQN